ncbi:MAG: polyphosphate kinase 2 family protein [Acidobacteria bacterium]|nr:polyphosphate kinase 2 family protein [Acidobacteriota bacterium]
MKNLRKITKRLTIANGKGFRLKDHPADWTGGLKDEGHAQELLKEGVRQLSKMQDRLYAQNTYSILIIFQAMDAAGKDGTIRHVMSGINPQGCQVFSFKAPSAEERDHAYLWRSMKAVPERGRIGIHNRSHYEEVVIARVHPAILQGQQMPEHMEQDKNIWQERFAHINDFERYLVENGTVVLKFFLNVSRKEQKQRFLDRIEDPAKNWKFSAGDVHERGFWKDYMKAYEDVFRHTSTVWAPWHIIPADNKWFMRAVVASIITETMEGLTLDYPMLSAAQKKELAAAKRELMSED